MRQILIFGGTTEGRKLAKQLSIAQIPSTVCVATEYGEIVMPAMEMVKVHKGRLDKAQMREMVMTGEYVAVVDATHPFAREVSKNLKESLQDTSIPYYRLKREMLKQDEIEYYFDSQEKCKDALKEIEGNILLTTGSKELAVYASDEKLRKRLFVRVLPSEESIKICKENGIEGKQIIAMQGPFNVDMNIAILKQFNIAAMVTKESGVNGGFPEKLQAASQFGIPLFVIGCPKEEGKTHDEICQEIGNLVGVNILEKEEPTQLDISLIGIGMGAERLLTQEAKKAIKESDYVFGATRVIDAISSLCDQAIRKDLYLARDIVTCINMLKGKNKITILFSGDVGFYSGCKKMLDALKAEEKDNWKIDVLPGISSVSYMSAQTGYSWQDANILSVHGTKDDYRRRMLDSIRHNEKTFVIVSGREDLIKIAQLINDDSEIWVGYNLSYENEWIKCMSAEECLSIAEDGLYTLLIVNRSYENRTLTGGISDDEFIRDKVPMTKEEIRHLSVGKLRLKEESILFDIGCGTGSVAIEAAMLSPTIKVVGFEKKTEAVSLIKENIKKHKATNVTVVEGAAPIVFGEAEIADAIPTHAFIGGSSGNLEEILEKLYQMNNQMRVVINAISLETIGQLTELLSQLSIINLDIISVSISRAKEVGQYHLMQGENPIYIASFDFV